MTFNARAAADYSASNGGTGFVAIQNGEIVLEEYGAGIDPGTKFDMQSATKSLFPLTMKAAINQGLIPTVDTFVSNFILPWKFPLISQRRTVSFRNLLSLVGGQEAGPPGSYITYEQAIQKPFLHPLGHFDYGGWPYQSWGMALRNALLYGDFNPNIVAFIDQFVCPDIEWEFAAEDEPILSHGAKMTTKQAALYGQVMLEQMPITCQQDGQYYWAFNCGIWKSMDTVEIITSGQAQESSKIPHNGWAARGAFGQEIIVLKDINCILARNGVASLTYRCSEFIAAALS